MNSYVSFMGGKGSSNDTLVSIMPPEAEITYMEPFAGSANTFFAKDKARVNILNDADEDIVVMHQNRVRWPGRRDRGIAPASELTPYL